MSKLQAFVGLLARPAVGVEGRHYYGLKCRACSQQLAVLNDSSQGAEPVTILGVAKIEIVCPLCNEAGIFQIDELKAFEHH